MIAPGALGDTAARVMLAVLAEPSTTGDRIVDRTGISRGRVWWQLRRLRRAGLVDWMPNSRGTIHATVRPVRFGGA